MHNLINKLSQVCFLSQEARTALTQAVRLEHYPTGYVLQKQNHPFEKTWFFVSGLLHCYSKFSENIVTTGYIYPEETVVCDTFPHFKINSNMTIQALQAFSSFTISRESLEQVTNEHDNTKTLIHTIQRSNLSRHLRDSLALSNPSCEERLLYIFKNYPELILNTPRDYLLSYLRISKNTYYKLRKKLKV